MNNKIYSIRYVDYSNAEAFDSHATHVDCFVIQSDAESFEQLTVRIKEAVEDWKQTFPEAFATMWDEHHGEYLDDSDEIADAHPNMYDVFYSMPKEIAKRHGFTMGGDNVAYEKLTNSTEF